MKLIKKPFILGYLWAIFIIVLIISNPEQVLAGCFFDTAGGSGFEACYSGTCCYSSGCYDSNVCSNTPYFYKKVDWCPVPLSSTSNTSSCTKSTCSDCIKDNYTIEFYCWPQGASETRATYTLDTLSSCRSGGCSGTPATYVETFKGAYKYNIPVTTAPKQGRPAVYMYCWQKWSDGAWQWTYMSWPTYSNFYTLSCYNDSQCPAGQYCDRSGNWASWQCKAGTAPPPPPPLPPSPSPSPSPPPAQPPPPLPLSSPVTSGSCGTGTARATGLVSTPQFQSGSKFGTTGACLIDPKAAFVPFKIPSYDDLKSLYFDQLKSARKSTISPGGKPANQGNLTSTVSPADTDRSIFVDGDLHITGNIFASSSIPIVVFVKDNLTISQNITYGKDSASSGLVFIVGKDITINSNVSEVNAILISQETIYTSGGGCTTSAVATSQLTINGSLISLNPDKQIKFCRSLSDNTQPAEKINHQVKYLILLRHLLSDTIQRWSEVP